MSGVSNNHDLYIYVLRQADNAMVLCQRLCEWVAHAPEIEEDIALTNIGLDMMGEARSLYQYAASLADEPTDEDALAFMRNERNWLNLLLVEQPNGNFADTIARQYFYDVWHLALLEGMCHSTDQTLSAIAHKSVKEARYHARHSGSWLLRLGDGTDISHTHMQTAVDNLWPFTPELFESDKLDQRLSASGSGVDLEKVKAHWYNTVPAQLQAATLNVPEEAVLISGGRKGIHTQHLGYLLAEMQILPRSMPGCTW